jgi:hypothetical protein
LVSSGSLILDKEKPNEIDGALYGKQAWIFVAFWSKPSAKPTPSVLDWAQLHDTSSWNTKSSKHTELAVKVLLGK